MARRKAKEGLRTGDEVSQNSFFISIVKSTTFGKHDVTLFYT
jgi:hypothetical protein